MATAIQRRRGNTSQHASFTGLAGEITIDTEKNTVVVHDGSTAGGYPLAKASEVEALGGADITAVNAGSGLTGGATSGDATLSLDYENLSGNLVPSSNNTFSLGSETTVWKDLFVGPNSIHIGGVALSLADGVLTFGGSNIAVAGSASSNADIRGVFSVTDAGGDGSFSYDSATGVYTYTGPDQSEANTRIDARLSGGTGITYNSGVIATTITQYTDSLARDAVSVTDAGGDGSLAYNSSTGVITYTGPDQSEANTRIDARLSGGTGVTYSSGVISIGQAVGTTSEVSFGKVTTTSDVVVGGNLTVQGTQVILNTTTVETTDTIFRVNSGGATGANVGFEANVGGSIKQIVYTTGNVWSLGSETLTAGAFTGNVTGTVSTLSNHDTDDLAEGTNLYFTAARARGNISVTDAGGDGSLSYDNSTGVITYTGPNQSEANARIDARLSGGTGITYTSGVIAATNNGTVTSVGGTGTVNGLTLTGTVTASGNLTLGGTLAIAATQVTSGTLAVERGGTGITSLGTGVATFLGTPSSANLAAAVTDETGSGALVFATSPTLVTPALGTPSSGTLTNATGLPIVAGTTGTLSVARGGTGETSYTNGQLLIGNTTGNTLAKATLTAGTGISVTNGAGSITIAATNNGTVTSVGGTGTVSGLTLTGTVTSTGNLTLGGTLAVAASNFASQTTKTFLAAPNAADGVPTFRTILASDVPTLNQNTTGSAATLTTPRAINGVNFNGSAAITITANTTNTLTRGTYLTGNNFNGSAATTWAVDATTTATANKIAARDASGDLYANIFQGTASSARYADLAERYEADAILEPGTVVCFGGEKEITACAHENDHAVAGVVSTDPAYMMNSAAGNNDTHPYIALTGRVPVKVVGPVAKGDLLVASCVEGHAMANNCAKAGTIIGKAIGSIDSGEGVVEVLVNLM